jgi:hypothetical protein
MTTLLSIDWDWVTGDCADGDQHGCCGWCAPAPRKLARGAIKLVRAGWIERLETLRSIAPVDPGGRFHVAECHADILRVVDPQDTTTIIHLDSHLDDADWFGLSCGSWRTFLPRDVEVVTESKAGDLSKLSVHDVFVCQSSPWTPASMDRFMWDLIIHLSNVVGNDPEFIGHRRMAQIRAWEQARRRSEASLAPADGA